MRVAVCNVLWLFTVAAWLVGCGDDEGSNQSQDEREADGDSHAAGADVDGSDGRSGGGGDDDTPSGDGGSAWPEPSIRIVSPTEGETLTGLAPFVVEAHGPIDDEFEYLWFGVEGESVTNTREWPGVLQIKTQNFADGEQTLVARITSTSGEEWEDTVTVVFDNPDFELEYYSKSQEEFANGNSVELDVELSEEGLELEANFENLDSEADAGQVEVEDLGSGSYHISYPISAENAAPDGEHDVVLTASDGDEAVTYNVPIRLRNVPVAPIAIEGTLFVDEPVAELDTVDAADAPALTLVEPPGALITGGVGEFKLRWTQPEGAPADKLIIRVEGYSGHYVLPIEPSPGETEGETSVLVSIPAGAPGAFDEGTFDFVFGIVDGIGQIVDWISETVLRIAVGSGGVQVTLSWDTDADLDLVVTDPNGNQIDFESPEAGSGSLDLDSNALCMIDGVNSESISWEESEEPLGAYQVRVNLYDSCEQDEANWRLVASYCGRSEEFTGSYDASDADMSGLGELITSFTVDCTQRVSGKVTFDRKSTIRPPGSSAAPTPVPLQYAPIRVVSTGAIPTTLAEGLTDQNGEYSFAFSNLDEDDFQVELEAAYVDPTTGDVRARATEVDESDTYRWESDEFPGDGMMLLTHDFHVPIADNAGALSVIDFLREGYEWINTHLRTQDSAGLGAIKANWGLNVGTPLAADPDKKFSFYTGGQIWINGENDAQDEWSGSVVLHEFMHFVVDELSLDTLPGGSHGAFRSAPDLSWSEGLATALGQRVLNDPKYVSEKLSSVFFVDIESGAQDINAGSPGEFFDTDDSSHTGRVIEWLISMIMWDLMDPANNEPHDRISKEAFALNIVFDPPPDGDFDDRSGDGVDLVDYIDHFRAGSMTRFDTELYCLTQERLFPYDQYGSAISCP